MAEAEILQPRKKSKQLGEILVEQGLITEAQLQQALDEHKRVGKLLGRVLIDMGLVTERDLVRALAAQVGLEFVDLGEFQIEPSSTALLPEAVARRYRALPIGERDGKLLVAMSDPANVYAMDDIRIITGREVEPVVATAADVDQAIRKFAGLDHAAEDLAEEAALEKEDEGEEISAGGPMAVEEAPIVKLVQAIIKQAASDRASDIHVEPTERDVRVRFRVDGVLHEVMHSPKKIQAGLISRLKVMADMNIAETRLPQDGRMSVRVLGRALDLRIATLPTVHGERVLIRVLDKSSGLPPLADLGFSEASYKIFEESFRKPYGAVLVCGPTGAGKTTSMYATLAIINSAEKNVITVEDPVEYRIKGVNQIQILPQAGLTFASSLRAILRADPDIILIGEIRDRETAVIAAESALTGHLVLSSMHTNDAASAVSRLIEMGIEPFLVASALDCVLAQRLARKLCEKCREAYEPDTAELAEAGYPEYQWQEIKELFRPVGCSACSKTGYIGRVGVFEVMPVTEAIERLTVERASSTRIAASAIEAGMTTLREDGLEKAKQGITSIQEILRVVV
ncbi:MAG: ATPase, T2SS/T4P/T4SS family [Actinomycetota bacterium]